MLHNIKIVYLCAVVFDKNLGNELLYYPHP